MPAMFHFQCTTLPVVSHALRRLLLLMLLVIASLTTLTAFKLPVAHSAAQAASESLPAATAYHCSPGSEIFKGIHYLPELGSSQPRNGTIVVYCGVDKSRLRDTGYQFNVTAFVNVWGNSSDGVSGSDSGDPGYQIVNVSMAEMSSEGKGYDFFTFAGYTSFDYTTILYRRDTLQPLGDSLPDMNLGYINAGTGLCVNYTETITASYLSYSTSGGGERLTKRVTYFVNDTTNVFMNNSLRQSYAYKNVDLSYINPADPTDVLDQSVYFAIQRIMNSKYVLNATSHAFFNLGPHGPYALDAHGYPVVLRNDAGEALHPLAVAASPPGKGSVRVWGVGAPTLVVAVLTCLAAAALL